MTTPTAGEVNRRIAEFCFEAVHEMEPGGVLRGLDAGIWDTVPDYMHDAASAIAAVEKVCRERHLDVQMQHPGTHRTPLWWCLFVHLEKNADGTRNVAGHSEGASFSEAASLALFAVLGGDEIQPTKGTR